MRCCDLLCNEEVFRHDRGGIAPDGARWIASGRSFFLPVEVLSARFRNTFPIYLREAFRKGQLHFHGELASLAQPDAFNALCDHSGKIKWVVAPRHLSADPNKRSSIWRGTPIAWPSPTAVSCRC